MSDLAVNHDAGAGTGAGTAANTIAAAPRGPAARRRAMLPGPLAQLAGTPRWLVTFADLVALLVAFFVMILSMSSFEPEAVARLNGQPAGANGAAAEAAPGQAAGKALARQADAATGAGARYIASLLLGQLADLGIDEQVTVTAHGDGIVLVMPADLLDGGAAANELRASLGRMAQAAPGRITLFGAGLIGDAASLYDAAQVFESVSPSTMGAPLMGVGTAGWLGPGEVAVAIRNPVHGAGPNGRKDAR